MGKLFTEDLFSIGKTLYLANAKGYFVFSISINGAVLAWVIANQVFPPPPTSGINVVILLVYYGLILTASIVILGFIFLLIGRPIGFWLMWIFESPALEEVEPNIFMEISQGEDSKKEEYVYKSIAIKQISPLVLDNVYLKIHQLVQLSNSKIIKVIDIKSKEIVWAESNDGVIHNRLHLRKDVPAKLYFARIDIENGKAETVGANKFYESLENGKYRIDGVIEGDNFSPRVFSILFEYDGLKIIQVENISKVSKALFLDVAVNQNIKMVLRSRIQRNWFKVFGIGKR